MSKIRFTAFSDLHHHPVWFKTDAPQRLTAIQERAVKDGSEFLIHMGDFCHHVPVAKELIRQYNEFKIPGFHVFGNHEFDLNSHEMALAGYGLECGYYYFDHNGFRFVIIDENYFSDFPGIYFHYSERNYFDHPQGRDWIPPEEVAWIKETVLSSPYPCILCSHATLEYEGGIQNRDEILEIIKASQKLPGRVMLCINGHYHRDNFNVIDNVAYLDLNSASFDWISNPHFFFPAEWYKEVEGLGNQIIFEKPLSATITIDTDGTIDIAGADGNFLLGISREMTDNPPSFRPCTPVILDRHVKLD
ncbi:MAG: metallophosphoesterase [Lentisphaeria bacterium]|nr:metallophosphoesterase [Lentisphaeria bacterium]